MCGWNNHRMLLRCDGFIQLLLAASMSLPGHSGSSALLWALEFRWYGRNTVLHPRSSRILPLTHDTPPLLQTVSFFSPQGTRDLSKLCANQPVKCGATRGWDHWKALRERAVWQASSRQGSCCTPHLVTQYFQKQAGRKRKRHPCKGLQQCLATAGKFKGRDMSISSPRLSFSFEVSSRSTAWELNALVHTMGTLYPKPWVPSTSSHEHPPPEARPLLAMASLQVSGGSGPRTC